MKKEGEKYVSVCLYHPYLSVEATPPCKKCASQVKQSTKRARSLQPRRLLEGSDACSSWNKGRKLKAKTWKDIVLEKSTLHPVGPELSLAAIK